MLIKAERRGKIILFTLAVTTVGDLTPGQAEAHSGSKSVASFFYHALWNDSTSARTNFQAQQSMLFLRRRWCLCQRARSVMTARTRAVDVTCW